MQTLVHWSEEPGRFRVKVVKSARGQVDGPVNLPRGGVQVSFYTLTLTDDVI